MGVQQAQWRRSLKNSRIKPRSMARALRGDVLEALNWSPESKLALLDSITKEDVEVGLGGGRGTWHAFELIFAI